MGLLAKPSETLLEHTLNVIRNAETDNERLAGIFHDVGKATLEFQKFLKGETGHPAYRHEILSAVVYKTVSEQNGDFDKDVFYAIITHHKSKEQILSELGDTLFTKMIYTTKTLLLDEIEKFLQYFGIGADLSVLKDKKRLKEAILDVKISLEEIEETKDKILLRGKLRQLDHLASALGDFEIRRINREATKEYFEKNGWTMKPLQRKAYKSNADVLIIEAPTGYGKTEASLLYADKFLKKGYRLHYIINNKASLNAMFGRLKRIYGEENVHLLYSYVAVTYYDMLKNSLENEEEAKTMAKALAKQSRYMLNPVKLTTIYTLFKMTHNDKNADLVLAEINKSVIVIDEVQMIESEYEKLIDLLAFLLKFTQAKVVIASATIADYLIEDVSKIARANGKELEIIKASDSRKLHWIELTGEEMTPENVKKLIKERGLKNVLIVVNKVKTAFELYDALKSDFKKVAILHSRFKFKDRAEKEREIIENFKEYDIVITTQVIEASVDISANVIITEVAPIPALIQRFGRVNRHNPKEPQSPNVFIFKSTDYRPYSKREIKVSEKLLKSGKYSKDDERRLVKDFYKEMNKSIDVEKFLHLEFADYLRRVRTHPVESDTVLVMLREDYAKLADADFIEKHGHLIPVSHFSITSYTLREKGFLIVEGEYDREKGLVNIYEVEDEIL